MMRPIHDISSQLKIMEPLPFVDFEAARPHGPKRNLPKGWAISIIRHPQRLDENPFVVIHKVGSDYKDPDNVFVTAQTVIHSPFPPARALRGKFAPHEFEEGHATWGADKAAQKSGDGPKIRTIVYQLQYSEKGPVGYMTAMKLKAKAIRELKPGLVRELELLMKEHG
jgi:hypothetical protein